MGQPEERRWDWGALRTPAGRLMAAETALWAALLPLLALSAPHALLPALLAALWGGATLGAALLRFTPRLPHGDCVEALRSCSGAVVAAVVALMAIVASRSVMAAVTFSLALGLALLYAYDAFGTIRTRLAPPHDPKSLRNTP